MGDVTVMLAEETRIVAPEGTAADALRAAGVKDAVAARLNGQPVDLSSPVEAGARLEPILPQSEAGLEILRHSTAHIMAQAVKSLFPGVKIAIGPAIESGFYYDFEHSGTFSPEDFAAIEARMREIIAAGYPLVREELSREEALALFNGQAETYKVELIQDLPPASRISVYRQGDFVDLCRGPHLASTGGVPAFKLISAAGAYWKGDERRPMLQRIYGTAFFSQEGLDRHLERLEEARRRDHRKLGRELDLYSISDEVGAGMVIWHPRGAMLRWILEDFERREHLRRGYQLVVGPQLLRVELWRKSGHFDNYRENMYFTEVDGQGYGIKPMNCLAHMMIYRSKVRSYRDLPIRYFELGTVHRHEKSGVVHGLLRVRQFTQDDAHILCTPEQLHSELSNIIDFVSDVMALFGFDYEVEVSTRPSMSIGSDEDWERATDALLSALKGKGMPFTINEGDGAFYGPKIDIKLKDALDRRWQCATIQCDFTLPERFDLTYMAADGERRRPVMLHRVILGAIERFIGVLIEHYAGAFPVWLAPVQATVLPIAERHNAYAENIRDHLLQGGARVEADLRNEKLGFKIREAQVQKIPYMLVVGDREEQRGEVSPRRREGGNLESMPIDSFLTLVLDESEVQVGGHRHRLGLAAAAVN
ncbi:MAG: threonine--tRNA ligase [Pseudomonadota bacterium]